MFIDVSCFVASSFILHCHSIDYHYVFSVVVFKYGCVFCVSVLHCRVQDLRLFAVLFHQTLCFCFWLVSHCCFLVAMFLFGSALSVSVIAVAVLVLRCLFSCR